METSMGVFASRDRAEEAIRELIEKKVPEHEIVFLTGSENEATSMAKELGSRNIRTNVVAPGFIKTEMSRAGREEAEYNDKVVARIPSGEWSDPEELAGTAIFLASSASRLINGATIPVDGGYIAN